MKKIKLLIVFVFVNLFGVSQVAENLVSNLTKNTIYLPLDRIGKSHLQLLFETGELYNPMPIFRLSKYRESEKIILFPKGVKEVDSNMAIAEFSPKFIKNKNLTESLFLLIVNYKSSKRSVYLTRGENLDFSNAEKIIDKKKQLAKIVVKTTEGSLEYIVDFNRKMNWEVFDANKNQNKFLVDSTYFLPIWLNTIKVGQLKLKDNTIYVALHDLNRDGVFDTKGNDFISLNPKQEPFYFTSFESSSACKIRNAITLKIGDTSYFKIKTIDRIGNYILLEKSNKQSDNNCIYPLEKIPNLSFLKSDSTLLYFKSLVNGQKYIYINFLTEYCLPCLKKIPDLESVAQKNEHKLTTISLLDRGDSKVLNSLIEKYTIKTLYGLSSNLLNNEFRLNGYPYGVLFDKNGTYIKEIRFLEDLEQFLSKNE